ncbi:DUF1493 family protein [Erwinia tracheiphila]|uniref:DUF1493 family protein n=1 Tax=Erwinia tracheiphila TaxID=65700 RepID=A0A345CQ63_9GAMM|nr:DUF1493 family protein [Erwinia tracheiphila]AXF75580.1 DUF1493 family protein [Erwinia tracheiphila]UIA81873.1 DUF1493 family protein [Erwinia tracheiphila]UIA90469.1 DUF1493 family protein [Erwinia tracheiphila]
MVAEAEVLEFFRYELSTPVSWKAGRIPLEMDTVLQDYAELDELPYAIDDYSDKFGIDISTLNIQAYYPVVQKSLFTRLFQRSLIQHEINQLRKPLTVRMFAESAKAGRWLYD